MLTGFQNLHCGLSMKTGRNTDADDIHIGCQHRIDTGCRRRMELSCQLVCGIFNRDDAYEELASIAQANGCLDRKGGVGEDGQARIDNGIAAAEIGESIGVRARNPVSPRANRKTIAPTDFWI